MEVDLWLQDLLQRILLVMAVDLSRCYQLFCQRALLVMAVDLELLIASILSSFGRRELPVEAKECVSMLRRCC